MRDDSSHSIGSRLDPSLTLDAGSPRTLTNPRASIFLQPSWLFSTSCTNAHILLKSIHNPPLLAQTPTSRRPAHNTPDPANTLIYNVLPLGYVINPYYTSPHIRYYSAHPQLSYSHYNYLTYLVRPTKQPRVWWTSLPTFWTTLSTL